MRYYIYYRQLKHKTLMCVIKLLTIMTETKIMIMFQKILYLNIYLSSVWIAVVAFFLYVKLHLLGHLTKYLTVTVFTLLSIIEITRLYLGLYGNLSYRVPELAGFLMMTMLMQMPLVIFFLFNPYLLSTPTEVCLHIMLWLITFTEVIFGFIVLKKASSFAKSVYLNHSKTG